MSVDQIIAGLSRAEKYSILLAYCDGDPRGRFVHCLCGVDWPPLVEAGLAVSHNDGASGVTFTPLGLAVRAKLEKMPPPE